MSTLAIFVLGFFVTTIVVAAATLVGLSEAGDPSHSRLSDLSALERALVDRESQETSPGSDGKNQPEEPP